MEEIELGNIETTWGASEWKEISQEDLVRVSEQIKKGNKYSGQIKSTSIQNNKYAKFLQYLIINITNEEFWKIANMFDVEIDGKIPLGEDNQIFLAHLLCGFMAPVYPDEIDRSWLQETYSQIDYHIQKTFLDYLAYVQNFCKTDQDTWRLDQESINKFVKYILVNFWFEDNQKLPNTWGANNITGQNNLPNQSKSI